MPDTLPSNKDLLVTLTDAELKTVRDALQILKDRFPMRRAVALNESRRLYKLGPNSLGFVDLARTFSKNHADLMADAVRPPTFDTARASFDLVSDLTGGIGAYSSEMNGLEMLLGAQLLGKALAVYEAGKRAAKTDPSLQAEVDELGRRFALTKAAKAGVKTAPANP